MIFNPQNSELPDKPTQIQLQIVRILETFSSWPTKISLIRNQFKKFDTVTTHFQNRISLE